MSELTQEELKKHLSYDPLTGLFTRIFSNSNRVKVGTIAGSNHSNGYTEIAINNKSYLAHRLVWLYLYGKFPDILIDHIDGNRQNNKLENIRQANYQENMYNSKIRIDNISGVKCVSWSTKYQKWEVRCKIEGELKYFGFYDDLELAKIVADYLRKKHHGEFATE